MQLDFLEKNYVDGTECKKIIIQLWTSLVCRKLSMSFKHCSNRNFK